MLRGVGHHRARAETKEPSTELLRLAAGMFGLCGPLFLLLIELGRVARTWGWQPATATVVDTREEPLC